MTYIIGYPQATIVKDWQEMLTDAGKSTMVLHPDDLFAHQFESDQSFLIGVFRDFNLRRRIGDYLDQHDLPRDRFVHVSAVVHTSADIQEGTVIDQFVTVLSGATIGRDCYLAAYSMIAHNTMIGHDCFLQPGAMIAGSTRVGNCCVFGIRSTTLTKLDIGDNIILGPSSMLKNSTHQPGTYLGSLARKVSDKTALCYNDN